MLPEPFPAHASLALTYQQFPTSLSDAQIEEKFRSLTAYVLSAKQLNAILDRLWHLEDVGKVAEIPCAFVFD